MSIKEGKYADILSTMSFSDINATVNVIETIRKKLTRLVVRSLVVVQSIDVVATFGVPLTTVGDLHKLINDIEAGKHKELLSGMANDDRMETLDALAKNIPKVQYNCLFCVCGVQVKEYQEKDKIGSKPDKNEKRGEAEKSQKQLQSVEEEKLKKMQKEGPE
nr:hypothetical protein [Tanacetum cinerariifolium]